MAEAETEVAMAMPLLALPSVLPTVASLSIERVRTPAALQAYARISAANWDPPDARVIEYYARAERALLLDKAPQWLYLGRLEGAPVATAEATVGGGVVGLYNITTTPAFRRRGIGLAMTAAPLADARAVGLSTGILQAAAAGVGVYERLGFRGFGTVTEFKPSGE
jgi:GNAT superfamily N-acetyltransferase